MGVGVGVTVAVAVAVAVANVATNDTIIARGIMLTLTHWSSPAANRQRKQYSAVTHTHHTTGTGRG